MSSHYKPFQLLARPARLVFHNPSLTTRSSRPSPHQNKNPLTLLPLLGSPLKFSVSSPPAAVLNVPTSPHTLFPTLNCFDLLPTTTLNFSSAINNLLYTITLISSWMSSNYFTLNPSKTEILLIGLPQQTSKIVNPSLFPSLPPNP